MVYGKQIKKHISAEKITIFFYLLIGFFSAVIYFGLFTVFWKLAGLSYTLSVSISYIAAAIFYFLGHRIVTFKSHDLPILPQVLKYLMMIGINYIITLIVVSLIVEVLHLSPYIGIFASLVATTFSGYVLGRNWIFAKTKV